MKRKKEKPFRGMVLVSTPWPIFSRPSIQLGALKSYLQSRFPDLSVQAHHLYLKVAEGLGYQIYQTLSERTWLAETVYAALLFPDRFQAIEKLFRQEAKGKPVLKSVGFKKITDRTRELSESLIDGIDWGKFGLAGFSICLCQLTSTLYFIQRIKKQFPALKIVVGGSAFSGFSNPNLFQVFPEIDFLVNGEGEIPLSMLVGHLKTPGSKTSLSEISGLVSRQNTIQKDGDPFCQALRLDDLPPPDYDDYFRCLSTFEPEQRFFPTLLAEISRGCWWHRPAHSKKGNGCAFCNLNLQWAGYRSKNPEQIISEIDQLTTKHKILAVAFTDNLIPIKGSEEIFGRLEGLNKDFRLFGEIRATTPRRILEKMKAAGMKEVQIGIEALSTSLLDKLNKGSTAIQNLEMMKNCEALGIVNTSNLILYFPGSDERDVADTLRCLEFAQPFHPLRFVRFWLGLGSPIWQNPKKFGIRAIFNHPGYSHLFPAKLFGALRFMIQAYRGDIGYQKRLWQPVKERMRVWKRSYAALHHRPMSEPILSFRDGRDFLIIRHRRLNLEPVTHRLTGTSRSIYLFCQQHRKLKTVVDSFKKVPAERIDSFLKMMVDKKLMFNEDDKYLSLAIPVCSKKG